MTLTKNQCSSCRISLHSYREAVQDSDGTAWHYSRDGERPATRCKGHTSVPPAPAKSSKIIEGEWLYEDELPEGYPYSEMYPFSKLGADGLGGVRIFPKLKSAEPAPPAPEGKELPIKEMENYADKTDSDGAGLPAVAISSSIATQENLVEAAPASDEMQDPGKCPHCNGYHVGGCSGPIPRLTFREPGAPAAQETAGDFKISSEGSIAIPQGKQQAAREFRLSHSNLLVDDLMEAYAASRVQGLEERLGKLVKIAIHAACKRCAVDAPLENGQHYSLDHAFQPAKRFDYQDCPAEPIRAALTEDSHGG